jgi:tRNA 5-methylaminomethyl-2-thiouridine biosynthesis bifunctional protein
MPRVLVPAECSFDEAGRPSSTVFGDVYHSADGALGQARHVFLGGNRLPLRWSGLRHFAVLETGFGFGVNFLATWAAWRADPARCEFLHFVSVEKHPLRRGDLDKAQAIYGDLGGMARELCAAWPMHLPGLHRLEFDGGRVKLTVAFGDVTDVLPTLRMQADAIYLDGFAPDLNPDMWTADIFKRVARKAANGATLATWSAAGSVRRGLETAGFEIETCSGFGAKREMTVGRFAPRWRRRRVAPPGPRTWARRRAVVVGAGLAGAAVCERLAARGWNVHLVERHAGPAEEASGNHAGAFHPLVWRDDGMLARLSRSAFLLSLARWQALERAGHRFGWSRCGLLQLQDQPLVSDLGLPEDYARNVDRAEAARICGMDVASGGLLYPQGGWVQPASLVRALLGACGDRLVTHFSAEASGIEGTDHGWIVRCASGEAIEADVIVFAGGAAATGFPGQGQLLTERVRGVVSQVPASAFSGPRIVVQGDGFVLPAVDGEVMFGATYEHGETAFLSDEDANRENIERVRATLGIELDSSAVEGRAAYRAVTRDRFPVVGALDERGLYTALGLGSRGLTWSSLSGEHLAALVEGEPQPVEAPLGTAMDPARFTR